MIFSEFPPAHRARHTKITAGSQRTPRRDPEHFDIGCPAYTGVIRLWGDKLSPHNHFHHFKAAFQSICRDHSAHLIWVKEKISITIDSDILEKLRDRAEYDDRSLSQYINLVLKRHLEELEKEKK